MRLTEDALERVASNKSFSKWEVEVWTGESRPVQDSVSWPEKPGKYSNLEKLWTHTVLSSTQTSVWLIIHTNFSRTGIFISKARIPRPIGLIKNK